MNSETSERVARQFVQLAELELTERELKMPHELQSVIDALGDHNATMLEAVRRVNDKMYREHVRVLSDSTDSVELERCYADLNDAFSAVGRLLDALGDHD